MPAPTRTESRNRLGAWTVVALLAGAVFWAGAQWHGDAASLPLTELVAYPMLMIMLCMGQGPRGRGDEDPMAVGAVLTGFAAFMAIMAGISDAPAMLPGGLMAGVGILGFSAGMGAIMWPAGRATGSAATSAFAVFAAAGSVGYLLGPRLVGDPSPGFGLSAVIPLLIIAVMVAIAWRVRRRRHPRDHFGA